MISAQKSHNSDEGTLLDHGVDFFAELKQNLKPHQLLTSKRRIRPYATGIKIGSGEAEAVVLPESLIEIWRVLKLCVKHRIPA